MKFIAVFLVLAFCYASASFAPSLNATLKWENCDTSTIKFSITGLTMSPDPAVPAKDVAFDLTGTLKDESVTGGDYTVKVFFGRIPVFSQNGKICDLIKDSCPCPCAPGSGKKGTLAFPVPGSAPRGQTLNGQLTATDSNSKEIACVKLTFQIAS